MRRSFLVYVLLSFLSGAFLFSTPAQAEFTVEDPKNVLNGLRPWYVHVPFEQAMSCGQESTYDSTTDSCSIVCGSYCTTKCEISDDPLSRVFRLFVDECSQDKAHIFGNNGLIVEVNKSEYDAQGGHWVAGLLRQLGQFIQPEGRVEIIRAWPARFRYIEDGRKRTLNAVEISADILFGTSSQRVPITIVITSELDGGRQVLQLAMGSDVFMQLRGLREKI